MTHTADDASFRASPEVLEWLLESDPSIRWQVMQDLIEDDTARVAAERARVAREGWGAQILRAQAADGTWGGATYSRDWTATCHTLFLLCALGVDPADPSVERAIRLVREHCTWGPEFGDSPFFEGEVEPCINGRALAIGAYFGEPSERLLARLLSEQLDDGGWNCEAPPSRCSSFHSTICVLEGLLELERATGPNPLISAARRRGEEYLLERRLFRSLRTGATIEPSWLRFSFPTHWHYDVLRGLDYLRRADVFDERSREAIDILRGKRDTTGRWPLEAIHKGESHVQMDPGEGMPSRWNTLRALRVLKWSAERGNCGREIKGEQTHEDLRHRS